jgi:hypothetical protein
MTFLPMTEPLGGHENLNILRHGLLIAKKRRANPQIVSIGRKSKANNG